MSTRKPKKSGGSGVNPIHGASGVNGSRIPVARHAPTPHASRPSGALAWGVGACLATGILLPVTPLAPWIGFTPLPPLFFGFLVLMVAGYLALVELTKRRFYRGHGL